MPAHLNIVCIHAHDLGRYCEPLGYAISAPNLMKLARQGALFRQCYSAAPSCAPSRASLFTGQYPHNCGMMGLPSKYLGYKLDNPARHLANFLRGQGYETALAGVQHEALPPFADPRKCLGYDRFLDHDSPRKGEDHDPTRTAAAAVEFLAQRHDRPFFLSVGFFEPHRNNAGDRRTFVASWPMTEPAEMADEARYCRPMPHMPDLPLMRREMANFKLGVRLLDEQVGLVLAALDRPEYSANTLVLFTTDHGPGIAEMKCTLSDRGTGVTLIVRGPGEGPAATFNGGKVVDALTQHLDLYPTLCELAHLAAPDWLQGRSLVPLVAGQADRLHEEVFTEQTYHYWPEPRPLRAVRTERYKYIRCYDPKAPWGVDFGPTQLLWEKLGYGTGPMPAEQLYDLMFDPHEANNLADRSGHEAPLADMRTHLSRWQERTGDPLRGGVVPPPPAPSPVVGPRADGRDTVK